MKKLLLISSIAFCFNINAQTQTQLWGTTVAGGQHSAGVIFNTDSTGNNQTIKYNFFKYDGSPSRNDIMQASDGKIYGMTLYGGINSLGTIFQYDPATNTYTKKIDLIAATGSNPNGSLIQATDGMLYGMTGGGGANNVGVIFQYNPITNIYTKKIDLSGSLGSSPNGSLLQATDGKLYGMTYSGGLNNAGVIFQYDPVTNIYVKKVDLSMTIGRWPQGSLIQASDGMLYGMTNSGGANNDGVIFQYNPSSNIYSDKFDFDGSSNGSYPQGSLLQATDGKLYGMTSGGGINNLGVIFQFDPSASIYSKKIDLTAANGSSAEGSFIQATDGNLYGMTTSGGTKNSGVIFQYNSSSNTYNKTFDFNGSSNGGTVNGANPYGSFIQATDGKLYGVTSGGGIQGSGTILQYDISTATQIKKIDFGYALNGNGPTGLLVQATDGMLYGMTSTGGINNRGTIFQFNPSTNIYSKKIDLDTAGGDFPIGSLIQATDGKLYGMTEYGGALGGGVIFQYDPLTNIYAKKFDFDGNVNGNASYGSLMQASDSKLYGMNSHGGPNGLGVLFQYDPSSNIFTKKYDFIGGNAPGAEPYGSLMQASDGMLYGMTNVGGGFNDGVIFQYNPSTSTYVKKFDFDGIAHGGRPMGTLFQASDGKLYGMASGGANSWGVLFQYDPSSNTYLKKIDLTTANGLYPYGALMQSTDGKLYGMTSGGGTNNLGVIFQYDQTNNTYSKTLDFNDANGRNRDYSSQVSFNTTLLAIQVVVTGIAENIVSEKITVSPNPFSQYTTLNTSKLLKDATLEVYNALGQQVKQMKNINGQTITLQRDNLPTGLYFIRFMQDNKIITVEKILLTEM